MVLALLQLILFAHGADPRPITWDEAGANLVKFFVTILLAGIMIYPILAPLFSQNRGTDNEADEGAPKVDDPHRGLVGWVALGLLLVLSMSWWLTRSSIVQLNAEAPVMEDHRHAQEQGGQVAMWADFHAEVSRIESGELRVHLSDSYNRPIAARFFQAEVAAAPLSSPTPASPTPALNPRPPATATPLASPRPEGSPTPVEARPSGGDFVNTTPALDDSYRFALVGQDVKAYRVKVATPGWTVTLKFEFDTVSGRRSLPIWCGTR